MASKDYKTKWITLDTTLYYAQVFEKNRDKAEMHEKTDGVTKVTIVLDEDQHKKLLDMGIPAVQLGYDTFKPAEFAGGALVYVAKRPGVSKSLKDDDGQPKLMGEPLVFDYNKAVEAYKADNATGIMTDKHITKWTMEDGLIGNETKAKVKLSVYVGTNKAGKPTNVTTLESIGITELVAYDNPNTDDNDPWF